MQYLLLFISNNAYAKALRCYVTPTMCGLFSLPYGRARVWERDRETENMIVSDGPSNYSIMKHQPFWIYNTVRAPVPVAARSAAARLLGLWVRIPPGHGSLFLVSVVCCQVEVSALGWSLNQRSPTECVVSESYREALIMNRLSCHERKKEHTYTSM